MIRATVRGNFRNAEMFLKRMKDRTHLKQLARYGPIGVSALQAATPVEHNDTARAWYYEIVDKPGYFSIHWLNSNLVNPGNIPIAVLIQYGHATGNGAFIPGRDYINPAMRPIFDQIAADMWKEVTK